MNCWIWPATGKLRQPGVLEQQVRRMLADPRSASLVTNFAEQWLYLRDLDAKKPNELLFPDFDESLRDAFRKETDLFVDSVLRGNRSVLELLSANYTFCQRAAGEALRHPQCSWQRFPARDVSARQPARRPAGAGKPADHHLLREPDFAW